MAGHHMSTTSRLATPEQVRLLVGLSCLGSLPLGAVAMIYVVSHYPTADQAAAWLAFVVAAVVGALMGLMLLRLAPVFGGSLVGRPSGAKTVVLAPAILLVVLLAAALVGERLAATMGYVFGTDAVLAGGLLARSILRR